jgi:hypothetical protein
MDKRYIFIFLLALAATAFGQNTNPRLRELEDFLRRQPHGVQFTQRNVVDAHVIRYDWRAQIDTITMWQPQLLNAFITLRETFASMRKEATESYMYEYHQDGKDTISYSVAFNDDREMDNHRSGNHIYYFDVHEAATFRYEYPPFGHYHHFCEEPRGIAEDEMKPFDIAAFEAQIEPALKAMMKLQGAKSYPVYWQHDKEYVDSTHSDGLPLYGGRLPDDPKPGVTTGTHYFIPAQHQAEPLVQQLDSLAYDYVNRHPEQPYIFTRIPIILRIDNRRHSVYKGVFHHVNGDIVESDDDEDDINSTKYNLRCYQDEDGLHILSITTKGVLWIPMGFQKMKSWVNGKATFRKLWNYE